MLKLYTMPTLLRWVSMQRFVLMFVGLVGKDKTTIFKDSAFIYNL